VPRGESGLNFGWPCFEGTLAFDLAAACERAVPPLLDFPRENGVCAVIGGVVIRDPRIAALAGRYLYGDLCTGTITAVALQDGRVVDSDELGVRVPRLTSFGVDGVGRVYATSRRVRFIRSQPAESVATPPHHRDRSLRGFSPLTGARSELRHPCSARRQIGVSST
jgi:hypothetical protein